MNKLSIGMVAICCALSLSALACKKDSKTPAGSGSDAAVDSGGSTTKKDAGGGGGTDAGGKDSGGATVTKEQCVTMTNTTTMSKVPATCSSCLCGADVPVTAACGTDCWSLIECYYANCHDKNGMTDMVCATSTPACMPFLTKGGTPAVALAKVIQAHCMSECVAASGADAGGDSAN